VTGAVVLLFIIECTIERHSIELTDPVSLSWRFSAQTTETDAPRSQVLCLGDSLLKHGLIPSIFAGDSSLRPVNLAAAQGSTLLAFSLLQRALDSGAQPRALIVNAKPAVLLGGPEVNERAWQEVMTLRDAIELIRITRNPPLVASTIVGRLLGSLRSRRQIRSSIAAALRGETPQIAAINPVLWRNWSQNAGANVASAASPFGGTVTDAVRRELYTDLFYVDPANAQAIERILDIAAHRKIPIYWVLFPLSPELQALRDQSGADQEHDLFLTSLAARHPGQLTVLDARHAGYPAHYFVDATHLNRRGALEMSHSIGAEFARSSRQKPRTTSPHLEWIALDPPSMRAGKPNDRLEDLDESKRIVRSMTPTNLSLR
jgi:hypothetical protein